MHRFKSFYNKILIEQKHLLSEGTSGFDLDFPEGGIEIGPISDLFDRYVEEEKMIDEELTDLLPDSDLIKKLSDDEAAVWMRDLVRLGTVKKKTKEESKEARKLRLQKGVMHVGNVTSEYDKKQDKNIVSKIGGVNKDSTIVEVDVNTGKIEAVSEYVGGKVKPISVEAFKKKLSTRPDGLLQKNMKMVKSGDILYEYRNFGIPALRGALVDEKENKLVFINTCPGAGDCIISCYALKGGYVQYEHVSLNNVRRLNYLMNDYQGFFKQLGEEIAEVQGVRAFIKRKKKLIIRWHDAGDFFSQEYLNAFIKEAVNKNPDVLFYAYTKIADIALRSDLPENLVINFSAGAKRSEMKKIDLNKIKNSRIVPDKPNRVNVDDDWLGWDDIITRFPLTYKQKGKGYKKGDVVFRDGKPVLKLNYGKLKKNVLSDLLSGDRRMDSLSDSDYDILPDVAIDELKTRLANYYKIEKDSILTYQEMLKIPVSQELNKWNVIIVPGLDGDVAASRRDVLTSFLLIH